MNKLLITALATFTLSQAQAGEIQCVGSFRDSTPRVTVEGNLRTDVIDEIKVTVEDEDTTEIGRAAQIYKDENYTPRKYKDHSRYDLSQLTEVESFGRFRPLDQCRLNLLVPNDALKKTKFKAPVIMNCDQAGGTITLSCTQNL